MSNFKIPLSAKSDFKLADFGKMAQPGSKGSRDATAKTSFKKRQNQALKHTDSRLKLSSLSFLWIFEYHLSTEAYTA